LLVGVVEVDIRGLGVVVKATDLVFDTVGKPLGVLAMGVVFLAGRDSWAKVLGVVILAVGCGEGDLLFGVLFG
jgi:hypothetical protein